jgi:hypothetical protein
MKQFTTGHTPVFFGTKTSNAKGMIHMPAINNYNITSIEISVAK